jgi:hypothetical protein
MLRRKLGPRTDDLKELRVKPVPTWCTSHSHMAKAKAKLSRIRITISQSKLLPLRRRKRIRRMRVTSCADLLIIGQRSVQIAKEENLNLSRRLRTQLYPALEVELVGTVIYPMLFPCFNLLLGGLILVQTFMCALMPIFFFLPHCPRFIRDDGEWVTCFCLWCWHGRSEVNFRKNRAAEERVACSFYQQESS